MPQIFQKGSRISTFADEGRWCVLRKLGEGQFAEVYEVRDSLAREKDVRYALKIEKRREVKSVKPELKVLRKLHEQHCQVCQLIDMGVWEERFFIVMELLGGNLAEVRREAGGWFTPDVVCSIGMSTLAALQGVHEAGFLHRDVKPANFAIFPPGAAAAEGTWKVIDFGLARRFVDESGATIPQRMEAAFRGSTTYASVNAHKQLDLGRRDDVWSWLYCLVELLSGTLPWRSDAVAIKDGDPVASTTRECRERVWQLKQECVEKPELLARNLRLPGAIPKISQYLSSLEFGSVPDYAYIRSCLLHMHSEHDVMAPSPFNSYHAWDHKEQQAANGNSKVHQDGQQNEEKLKRNLSLNADERKPQHSQTIDHRAPYYTRSAPMPDAADLPPRKRRSLGAPSGVTSGHHPKPSPSIAGHVDLVLSSKVDYGGHYAVIGPSHTLGQQSETTGGRNQRDRPVVGDVPSTSIQYNHQHQQNRPEYMHFNHQQQPPTTNQQQPTTNSNNNHQHQQNRSEYMPFNTELNIYPTFLNPSAEGDTRTGVTSSTDAAVVAAWAACRPDVHASTSRPLLSNSNSQADNIFTDAANAVHQGLLSPAAQQLHRSLVDLSPVEAFSVMAAVVQDSQEGCDPESCNMLAQALYQLSLHMRHHAKRADAKFCEHVAARDSVQVLHLQNL